MLTASKAEPILDALRRVNACMDLAAQQSAFESKGNVDMANAWLKLATALAVQHELEEYRARTWPAKSDAMRTC